MEIFDQYFHDIKQSEKAEGSDQEYSDVLSMLYAKIGMFEMERGDIWMVNNMLNAIGGLDAIGPSEGIVFKYKGKTYKFTGAFAPINQITGLMTF